MRDRGPGGQVSGGPVSPPSQDQTAVENPEEKTLFAQVLTATMAAPDIACVGGAFGVHEIQDYIEQRRTRIWDRASGERALMRSAAADLHVISAAVLPVAEVAARELYPQLIAITDEALRQEEALAGAAAQGTALAATLHQAASRALTEDEEHRADQVIAGLQRAIGRGSAWLEAARTARAQSGPSCPGQGISGAGRASDRFPARMLTRLRGLARSGGRGPADRSQQVSRLQGTIRELSHDIHAEGSGALLQLSDAVRQLAEQDDGLRTATARAAAAAAALQSALRETMLPEVRVCIGLHC